MDIGKWSRCPSIRVRRLCLGGSLLRWSCELSLHLDGVVSATCMDCLRHLQSVWISRYTFCVTNTKRCKVCACRLPAKVQALFRHLHEEKGYGTLTLLAGGLAVPLLTGEFHLLVFGSS